MIPILVESYTRDEQKILETIIDQHVEKQGDKLKSFIEKKGNMHHAYLR